MAVWVTQPLPTNVYLYWDVVFSESLKTVACCPSLVAATKSVWVPTRGFKDWYMALAIG